MYYINFNRKEIKIHDNIIESQDRISDLDCIDQSNIEEMEPNIRKPYNLNSFENLYYSFLRG